MNADKLPRALNSPGASKATPLHCGLYGGRSSELFYVATTDIVDAQQRILQRERDIDALLRVLPC